MNRSAGDFLRPAFSLFLLLLLTACASLPDPAQDWPGDLPPLHTFLGVYAADKENQNLQTEEEYLAWVRSFYTGNLLSAGWLTMTDEVLDGLPAEQAVAADRQLAQLGRQIGAEWAKDNTVRRLDTRCIVVWQEALVEALYQDELPAFLLLLQADVDALLQGSLAAEDIVLERYYSTDFELF